MNSLKPPLLLILLTFFNQETFAQALSISQILASNTADITDETGRYEDWITVYNPGSKPFDLAGCYVTDDLANLTKYRIPVGEKATVIGPRATLRLWASDKIERGVLHLPFKLSADGEAFAITAADGITVLDSLSFGPQRADVVFSRRADNLPPIVQKAGSSPSAPAVATRSKSVERTILPPPVFSVEAGFYTSGFPLELTSQVPGAKIYYTLDGSEPNPDNLNGTSYIFKSRYVYEWKQIPKYYRYSLNTFLLSLPSLFFISSGAGFLTSLGIVSGLVAWIYDGRAENSFVTYAYDAPITISDRSGAANKLSVVATTYDAMPRYLPAEPVSKAQVVRAVVTKPGALPSRSVTRSYFVGPQGRSRYTLPVVSLTLPENELIGFEEGLYVPGADFHAWRLTNVLTDTSSLRFPSNLAHRGKAYERKAWLEYFDQGDRVALSQGVGVRLGSSGSRRFARKTLRLYARREYGKSDFRYPFFEDSSATYRQIVLRGSGNDWHTTLFRDAVWQRIVSHLPLGTQASQPVILFIDGEYWGVHNLRERLDKHHIAATFGLDADKLDILERKFEVEEGSKASYLAMLDYLEKHSLRKDSNFKHLTTLLDPENFMDYQIAEIFCANNDWIYNNIKYWRKQTTRYQPDAPYGHDGRWRWLFYDLDNDGGRSDVAHETLAGALDPIYGSMTILLRKMLENPAYKQQFINRFADLLNTTFLPARTVPFIRNYQRQLAPEMAEHTRRWRRPANVKAWEKEVDDFVNFAQKRPDRVREHIAQHFKLQGTYYLTLAVPDTAGGYVRVNSIDVRSGTPGVAKQPYPWRGRYFRGIPVQLRAFAKRGYRFSHWAENGERIAQNPALTLRSDSGNQNVEAVFVPLSQ